MKNFLIVWIIFQLMVIGMIMPLVWNSSVGEKCQQGTKMEIHTMFIFITIPLIWFIDSENTSCIK